MTGSSTLRSDVDFRKRRRWFVAVTGKMSHTAAPPREIEVSFGVEYVMMFTFDQLAKGGNGIQHP
jgi:hypothetical protein